MTPNVGAPSRDRLVGRAAELASLEQSLEALGGGGSGAVVLVGEPGIGKTRLLRELAARAERCGYLVLSGSASELERDLPFSVFVDALDEYVEGLQPSQLSRLDEDVQAELAHIFPSLLGLGNDRQVALQHERYRSHRAVRALLERLAAEEPLVLVLDDLQWADGASVELLGALLRRPPSADVLLAVALRPRHLSERLAVALERAHRAGAATRLELGSLSAAESRELLGETVGDADASVLYTESGGNPFYLEQLARSLDRAAGAGPAAASVSVIGIPSAVAASLIDEIALLSKEERLVLEGAAVAGDPFEPELASAAAGTSEPAAIDALDQLLRLDLIRSTEVPRRFRFRHPLVRRAVYEATAAAWRLGAHERCADALAARGATAVARAHHVERSAREGDLGAVALLREAGEATARLAPANAAHWFSETLRLLPQTAPIQERVELLLAHAGALTAAGYFTESHQALLEALAVSPDATHATRARLQRACAGVERLLGQHEQARARLATALDSVPDAGSPEAAALMIELSVNGFWRSRYTEMLERAERAVRIATALGDAPLTAAALAVRALAESMAGKPETAGPDHAEAAALIDSLSDDEAAERLDSLAWLAGMELYADRYVEADAHAGRALAIARATGQGDLFLVLVQELGRVWFVRGKLAEAADLLDGGTEAARLLGNTHALVWNLFNRSFVALATGDVPLALATARESVELSHRLDEGFHSAWAAVRLADVFLETGQPQRATELLLGAAGGEGLVLIPGSWRAYCLELLTRCQLALGLDAEAQDSAAAAESWASTLQFPLAAAWAARASAAVKLYTGEEAAAAVLALASTAAATEVGAPIEAARSRTLAGRALARSGEHTRALAELERGAADLESCGALRYRDEAEHELGKLGHRIHRRTRAGKTSGTAVETLTERELQLARLVVERKTNAQIAAELFLSKKTVETHLRNIFRKIDVSTRAELAGAVEHAHDGSHAAPRS